MSSSKSMIPAPASHATLVAEFAIDQALAHSAGKGNAATLASIAPNTPSGGLPLRPGVDSRPCS